jgi:hypothetical protein
MIAGLKFVITGCKCEVLKASTSPNFKQPCIRVVWEGKVEILEFRICVLEFNYVFNVSQRAVTLCNRSGLAL